MQKFNKKCIITVFFIGFVLFFSYYLSDYMTNLKDLKKGLCQKYVLSKNNIIKAIETTILREFGTK